MAAVYTTWPQHLPPAKILVEVEVEIAPLFDEPGSASHFVAVCRERGGRKHAAAAFLRIDSGDAALRASKERLRLAPYGGHSPPACGAAPSSFPCDEAGDRSSPG